MRSVAVNYRFTVGPKRQSCMDGGITDCFGKKPCWSADPPLPRNFPRTPQSHLAHPPVKPSYSCLLLLLPSSSPSSTYSCRRLLHVCPLRRRRRRSRRQAQRPHRRHLRHRPRIPLSSLFVSQCFSFSRRSLFVLVTSSPVSFLLLLPPSLCIFVGKDGGPAHTIKKTMRSDRGWPAHGPRFCHNVYVALFFFDRAGGPAHTRQYAGTPAVPVKTQCKMIAGCPRAVQYFAAMCASHCF